MLSTTDLIAETRKANGNLHRFNSDNRWRRIHDESTRDYQSGEWVREKIFSVGRLRMSKACSCRWPSASLKSCDFWQRAYPRLDFVPLKALELQGKLSEKFH